MLRILSYNILDGAVGRADPVAEVIEAQKADVVVLVEADDTAVTDRIVRRLGMDHIVAPGRGHSVAVLSRPTIVHSVNHALLQTTTPRCLLEVLLRLPGGIELPLIALHGHPRAFDRDEQIRQEEMQSVLRVTHEWRTSNRPHILAGDFNANAPIQKIDPQQCKEKTRQAWQENGGQIPRRVIENLQDHGYVDTLEAVHGEKAGEMYSFTTHETAQRIDYIFTFGLAREDIRDAWIEQDRLAKFASDHYPVGAAISV